MPEPLSSPDWICPYCGGGRNSRECALWAIGIDRHSCHTRPMPDSSDEPLLTTLEGD